MKRGDKDRKDMKKFTFKGVLDGFRSSVQQSSRPDQEIHETLRSEHFDVKKTFRHGFPFQPTAIAFDPVQKILAIGSKCGSLRLLGRPGVDAHAKHESPLATAAVNIPGAEGPPPTLTCGAVLQIQFLVNEGALVTATADDSLHLWNFRQKVPQVVQSLKFQRERITCLHLPLQSKWLYVGTERGNIHVVNIETFQLSGYIINWNKAIELTRKTHPGPVLHLSDNPADPSKILIGYESGQLVLWDLRTKMADCRWQSPDAMRSAAWHYEGKQFMSSHVDGSLITWTLRQPKPINVSYPHAKTNKDGKLEQCKAIQKVEWKSARSGEPFVIFSGGMANDKAGRTPSITVVHCKTTTVLEMEHNVVDFITLCESPWISDLQEPYAIVVLLHNDLVVIDLQTTGFPCIENPYPMDIHESPVTCCSYLVDCPADLIPAFYSVGTHNRAGFSKREWPINGGEWSSQSACSYSEIIITGHADGSVKFWDASAGTLQVLYKLKTAKVFDKQRPQSMDSENEDPFAVQLISLCPESRKLCVAGAASYVVLFKFKKTEAVTETTSLEIPIIYDIIEEGDCSPECEYPPLTNLSCGVKTDSSDSDERKGNAPLLKVRPGPIKKPAGFQAQLVCLTPYHQGQPPGRITALAINSSYGLMAYGNESGLVIVDIVQKVCLLNIGSPDLYGAQDPYSRAPRSPKRGGANDGSLAAERESSGQARSPSIDQINGMCCVSPTGSGGSRAGSGSTPAGNLSGGGQIGGGGNIGVGSGSMSQQQQAGSVMAGVGSRGVVRRSRSQDKLDSSFSRSRSSSMSSLENISSEAIQCLAFADSYSKKSEPTTSVPTLWVGTSLGSVLSVLLQPPEPECRSSQPCLVSICGGPMFRLKGSILTMSFLDCNGALIPYTFETWRDENKERKDRTPTKSNRPSPTLNESRPNSADGLNDRQFVVIASEKQARVVALPSQTCIYRQQICDTDFVVKAEIVSLRDSVCLACYVSSGKLLVYSLPSLRPLVDTDFLPLADLSFQTPSKQGIIDPMLSIWGQQIIVNEDADQIAKTFCFSNRGHGLFLSSPSELQKFTLCSEFSQSLNEMMGDLFLALDMPEAPKESFFRGWFGGATRNLDREELFGEASGKALKTVAKHIPGPNAALQDLNQRATSSANEISRAHQLMLERGDKLSQLEERTARMAGEAESFSGTAHNLMLKYKDKKWYQL
ncbi:syntaxin-binding protein 5 isoform X5 [Chrysoperla carnea]|uniref:syntaxin-binding protein 5 isoform X5 n=1 Tax=Chrysoperla carnea TaxID=189513 RepID=UPI001D06B84A|nr:syntaxin-binding protein 5 isoform X5 [Chrysoperla carnea]